MDIVNCLKQIFFSEKKVVEKEVYDEDIFVECEECKDIVDRYDTTVLTRRGNACDYCEMAENECPLHDMGDEDVSTPEPPSTEVGDILYGCRGERFIVASIQGMRTLGYIGDLFGCILNGEYEDYIECYRQWMYKKYCNMSKYEESRMSYLEYKACLVKHGAFAI